MRPLGIPRETPWDPWAPLRDPWGDPPGIVGGPRAPQNISGAQGAPSPKFFLLGALGPPFYLEGSGPPQQLIFHQKLSIFYTGFNQVLYRFYIKSYKNSTCFLSEFYKKLINIDKRAFRNTISFKFSKRVLPLPLPLSIHFSRIFQKRI